MKKLIIAFMVLCFASQSFGEIIYRRSESIKPVKSLEFLQGGIILRIDARQIEKEIDKEKKNFWIYDEFWVSRNVRPEVVESFIASKSRAIKTERDELVEEYRTKVVVDTTADLTIKDLLIRIEIIENKIK